MQQSKNLTAQGTIEYLIIIAVVVVIALVVVSILTGFLSTGNETGSQSKQISALTGEFSVSELAVTTDGNFVLNIKNNTDTVTITDIQIIDQNNQPFTYTLSRTASQNFVIYNSNQTCTEGTKLSTTIKISYTTKLGLNKTYWLEDLPFECVNYSVTNSANNSTSSESSIIISDLNYTWYFTSNDGNYTFADGNCEIREGKIYLTALATTINYYSQNQDETTPNWNLSQYIKQNDQNYWTPTGELDWNLESRNDTTRGGWGELINDFNIRPENLVGLWHLNGDANDSSGNENHGNWSGTEEYENGLWNTDSGNFNGSSYINKDVSNFEGTSYVGTISMWIKTTNSWSVFFGSYDVAVSNKFLLFSLYEGKPRIYSSYGVNDQVYGSTNIADGEWHHVVFLSNNTSYSIYVDGKLEVLTVYTGSNSGTWFGDLSNRDNIVFGARKKNTIDSYYTGKIEELSVWNTILNSEDVKQLYEQQKGQWLDTNLVAYYKFNEKNSTTIYDSVRGNTGTLTGGADTNANGLWDSNALFLNGTSYVNLGNINNLGTDKNITISVWVKHPTTIPNKPSEGIVSKLQDNGGTNPYVGYNLHFLGSSIYVNESNWGKIRLNIGDGTRWGANVYSTEKYNDDKWHHVVGTMKRGEGAYLYIDGNLVNSISNSFTANINSTLNLEIGRAFSTNNQSFTGLIDEVKIYDRALEEWEIVQDYNSFLEAKFITNQIIDASAETNWNQIKINTEKEFTFGSEIQINDLNELQTNDALWDENIVGVWHLNETSGDVIDSANSNNGTISGVTRGSKGLWGGKNYSFASGNYIDFGSLRNLVSATSDISASFWVKTTNTIGELFGTWNTNTVGRLWGYLSGGNAGLNIYMGSGKDYWVGFGNINDGKWHQLAFSIDRDGTMSTYKDGAYVSSTDISAASAIAWISSPLRIGVGSLGAYGGFVGNIEEVNMWDRIITSNEVKTLYDSQATGYFYNKNLVGLWHLNETSGLAQDASIHNNNATSTSATQGVDGLFGTTAYSFSGSSSNYIDVGNILPLGCNGSTDGYTLAFWAKGSGYAVSTERSAGGIGDGYITVLSDGRLKFTVNSNGGSPYEYSSTSSIYSNTNNWNFYAITIGKISSGVTQTIDLNMYINGTMEKNQLSYVSGGCSTFSNIEIGRHRNYTYYTGYFNGKIDEVVLWDIKLDEEKILDLYRKGVSRLDLNVYSCSDASCETKTGSQYFTDVNSGSWFDLSSSVTNSRYLGYDFNFYQAQGFDNNANYFVNYGSYFKDINVIATTNIYNSSCQFDFNIPNETIGTYNWTSITDVNNLGSGSIDYNLQFDNNGTWFNYSELPIQSDYNTIIRAIITDGNQDTYLDELTLNYTQTN